MTRSPTSTGQSYGLHVAFVSDAVYPFNKGGKEKRLHEISTRLARQGFRVDIYTMRWWDGPSCLRVDGVTMHALTPLLPLYRGRRRSIVQAVVFGLACLRLLVRRFDVLDVDHMPFFPLFSARLVTALRGRRLVATWHEVWGREYWTTYLGRSGRLAWLIERWAAAMPDAFISVSEQTSRGLRGMLGVTKPVWTVPLGVDLDGLGRVPAAAEHIDVLYAGRLLDSKRVDVLLRAISRISASRPGIRGVIVGEGPERLPLERLADGLGIAGSVRFSDFLPGSEVYGLMKAAGVFVLPSVREGFGLVVLEANACGAPVVTVDHPGNASRHLVEEGRNGYVCGLEEDSLAEAILTALERPEHLRPAEVVAARRPSVDWDSVARRVGDVLAGRGALPASPLTRRDVAVEGAP